MADLISVLRPYDYVCKQSDASKSLGGHRRVRIYDVKVTKKEGIKLLKKLIELSRQEDRDGRELRDLVRGYIARLREEVADKFGNNPASLQKFQEIAEELLRTDAARFSFATTKTKDPVCFVALVAKQLEESGNIVEMMIYFLQDGVKVHDAGGAEQQEGAVGGAAEAERCRVTLVLPIEWKSSFSKSLDSKIHLCSGHVRPALDALRTGRNSYNVDGKICNFNSSGGNRELVQARKKFKEKLSYKLNDMNPRSGGTLCKVHLNGDGSDCYLVYVEQNYSKLGKVYLLVGVFNHTECNIKTGARKKQHTTQKGGDRNMPDATLDMEAAEEYLQ